MKKMKKWIAAVAFALGFSLLAPALLPIAGNGAVVEAANDKTKVKQTVKNFFKYSKTLNTKKMKTYVDSNCKKTIDEIAPTPAIKAFMKKRNKSLSYSIKNVKVSGNKASVKVKCKYLNSKNAYGKMMEDLMSWLAKEAAAGTDYSAYTEKELVKIMDEVIKKSFADNPKAYDNKYRSKTFTIKLQKVKGKWKISQIDQNLVDAISSNYQSGIEEYFKSLSAAYGY